MTDAVETPSRITLEREGAVLLIGLNRPDKRNAADFAMLQQLAIAYAELENDPDLRAVPGFHRFKRAIFALLALNLAFYALFGSALY